MGRLIGLELYNFKSYRGKAVIGFGSSNFTSIIGPNGSGKSNMMDAISFVLGLNSSHLRSSKIKDLIYRGRRRETVDSEDLSVELDQNPTSAYVLGTYEKDNGEILRLKRSISLSGHSDYQINEKSVTRLNYTSVLKSENILIKARNFLVFQGDVELIASQNPKDLSGLIEHISGSNEYVTEYEKLKEEMEKAREVTNSVFSQKRTLNSESKQYKEQADEQRLFEKNLVLRNEYIKKIQLYKLYHNEKKHDDLKKEIEKENILLDNLKKDLANKEKTLKSLVAEYSKGVLELRNQDKELEESKVKIEQAKRRLIPLESNQSSLTSRISSQTKKIEDLGIDIKSQQEQISKLQKQLHDSQKLYDKFETKVRESIAASSSLNLSEAAHKEYEEIRSRYLASEGSELEEKLALLLNDKETINSSKVSLSNQKLNAQNRIQDLKTNLNLQLKSDFNDVDDGINQITTQKNEKAELRKKLIKQRDIFNQKELQINTQLRDVLLKLEDLTSQQRESNKQKKLRENVIVLKRLLPAGSIKGLVHELVKPSEQKYEIALVTLLGRNSDSIVVESAAIASKCIEILKERRAGVASFIPLDSIEFDPINLNYLRSISDSAVAGIDIVEYEDKSLEPAINFVIGNALVAKDITIARSLRWDSSRALNNKIVTLQGAIIHKSGQMTGGMQTRKSSASVSWDKQEWTKLNDTKELLMEEVMKLQESRPKDLEINLLAEEISSLEDKLPLLKNRKSSLQRAITDRENEIDFQSNLCSGFNESLQNKEKELSEFESKIENIKQKISESKTEIYGDFCTKWSLPDGIEKYEELHGSALRIRAKERSQFVKAISVLQNKLDFEEGRLKETITRKRTMENQIVDLKAELEEIVDSKTRLEEELDQTEAEYEISKSERKKADQILQSKSKHSKSVESDVNEISKEVSNMSKKISSEEEMLLKIVSDRAMILKNCKIQNIILPLEVGDLDSLPVGEDTNELFDLVYDIEVDYEMLDDKFKESFNTKLEVELEALLQDTIEKLERLTPNAKAQERFKDVEKKLRSYDKDYTVARQQERKTSDKFAEMKEKRYQKFMEAFNHISSRIDSIYKELTKSSTSPMGGSAILVLEDEDTPYLSGVKYHAMPPMKRFQDMELLSGGEKTMAALALLFAIHSFQPAPFFVLDEIDAALDNNNVAKIGNYIKNHAGPNFQFIVISLKSNLYEKSDALVGIYREQNQNSSKTITLDLDDYPDEDVPLQSNVVAAAS
ncbi:SMC1 [Candida pseudojiufengensis]|uniref:SMC1 n=1 Tax=Candida pseudojiufengensis TaxID=497109 RepID=UPI0022241504|nr:SMC1 [Candida pseudojiufengensis]KAI5966793.1 SMC1 [Candida pseudojiufengensis]